MGNEIAMFREWDETREPDWELLKLPAHDAFLSFMTELNGCYGREPALWALDGSYDGFKWAEAVSDDPCVFGYTRTDGKEVDLILLNFSDRKAELARRGRIRYAAEYRLGGIWRPGKANGTFIADACYIAQPLHWL